VYRDLQQEGEEVLEEDVSWNPSSISMSRDWISSSWDTVANVLSFMLISCVLR